MHLALSTISQQALWVLLDSHYELLDSRSSLQEDQIQMSSQLGSLLDDLLLSHRKTISDIKSLAVVSGPGAFTGLRMGISFAEGLCLAKKIKKISIPSFYLVNRPYVFPLRHTKAPSLSLEEYLNEGYEALLLKDAKTFELISKGAAAFENRGFKGSYPWPNAAELARAYSLAADNLVSRFEIEYGLDPKIFGQRRSV